MNHNVSIAVATCCLFFFVLGCAGEHADKGSYAPAVSAEPGIGGGPGMSAGMGLAKKSHNQSARFTEGEQDATKQNAAANRKIIYSADLAIVVEDFDPVESAILGLVKKHGAFIADASMGAHNREKRSGTWTIRTPADSFDDFLAEVGDLGVVVERKRNSEDVTDEYVDVRARIVNKKKLEARIIKLLERPDDKIQHVIEVERELGRVREDIERMEGRIRYLSNRVELTTVTIAVTEEKEPLPQVATSFSGRVSQAWKSSLLGARRGFENFVVWLAGNVFVIAVWAMVGLIVLLIARRLIKKDRAARAAA